MRNIKIPLKWKVSRRGANALKQRDYLENFVAPGNIQKCGVAIEKILRRDLSIDRFFELRDVSVIENMSIEKRSHFGSAIPTSEFVCFFHGNNHGTN